MGLAFETSTLFKFIAPCGTDTCENLENEGNVSNDKEKNLAMRENSSLHLKFTIIAMVT